MAKEIPKIIEESRIDKDFKDIVHKLPKRFKTSEEHEILTEFLTDYYLDSDNRYAWVYDYHYFVAHKSVKYLQKKLEFESSKIKITGKAKIWKI